MVIHDHMRVSTHGSVDLFASLVIQPEKGERVLIASKNCFEKKAYQWLKAILCETEEDS